MCWPDLDHIDISSILVHEPDEEDEEEIHRRGSSQARSIGTSDVFFLEDGLNQDNRNANPSTIDFTTLA